LNNRAVLFLRYALLGTAAVLIAVGLLRGEQWDVMQKAVRVCLECIGIG